MATSLLKRTSSQHTPRAAATLVALLATLAASGSVSAVFYAHTVAVCANGSVHWTGLPSIVADPPYYVRSAETGVWSIVESNSSFFEMAGSDGRLYQRNGVKRDCDGLVLGQAPTRDLLSDPALRVVVDENGRFLYFNYYNGSVDSQNVLHLIENRSGQLRYRQIAPNDTVTLDVALSINITSDSPALDHLILIDSQDQPAILWNTGAPGRDIRYTKLNRQGGVEVNATDIATWQWGPLSLAAVVGPDNRLYVAYATDLGAWFVRVGPDGNIEVPETVLLEPTVFTVVFGLELGPDGDLHLLVSWLDYLDRTATGPEPHYLRLDTSGGILEGPTRLRPPATPPRWSWLPVGLLLAAMVAVIAYIPLRGLLRSRVATAGGMARLRRRPPSEPPPAFPPGRR